ncbi:MAG: hypothetical protein LBS01_04605, partial [Prevotellaceae bacterium]|nr:hypothetical protein [Prevotellaceae bacterium]
CPALLIYGLSASSFAKSYHLPQITQRIDVENQHFVFFVQPPALAVQVLRPLRLNIFYHKEHKTCPAKAGGFTRLVPPKREGAKNVPCRVIH